MGSSELGGGRRVTKPSMLFLDAKEVVLHGLPLRWDTATLPDLEELCAVPGSSGSVDSATKDLQPSTFRSGLSSDAGARILVGCAGNVILLHIPS